MKNYSFYKWRIWAILAFSFVMSLFHRSALGTISEDLSKSLGFTASELGSLVSVTFYTYALLQVPAGILLDLYGFKKINAIGMFCTGLGSILLGSSHTLTLAVFSRFLIGAGTSVIFISILKMQQSWFSKKEFTKASGLLSFIGNIGGIIATFPLAFLATLMGWRGSMFLMGGLCLIIGGLVVFFVKDSPTEYGFESIGESPVSPHKSRSSIIKNLLLILKQKVLWRNFFVLFTLVGCTTTLTSLWGINYLTSVYGLSSTDASFYVAFIIYGLIAGSVFIDKIAQYFEGRLLVYPRICCVIVSGCWAYILFVADGKPPLYVLASIFFIMGFLAMSHIIAFADIANHTTVHTSGLASSIVNSGEFIGSSLISILIGTVLDFTWLGQSLDGITRFYDASSYILAFHIFFVISILGIFTSFIGSKAPALSPSSSSAESL